MSSFAERLRQLRHENNLTQEALSTAVGVSKSSINMYERGEREPGFETLEAIADFFNVDFDYLHGRTDNRGVSLSPAIDNLLAIDKMVTKFKATPNGDDLASVLLRGAVCLLDSELSDALSPSERKQAHEFASKLLELVRQNSDLIKKYSIIHDTPAE